VLGDFIMDVQWASPSRGAQQGQQQQAASPARGVLGAVGDFIMDVQWASPSRGAQQGQQQQAASHAQGVLGAAAGAVRGLVGYFSHGKAAAVGQQAVPMSVERPQQPDFHGDDEAQAYPTYPYGECSCTLGCCLYTGKDTGQQGLEGRNHHATLSWFFSLLLVLL
jgi:hypothetical protein